MCGLPVNTDHTISRPAKCFLHTSHLPMSQHEAVGACRIRKACKLPVHLALQRSTLLSKVRRRCPFLIRLQRPARQVVDLSFESLQFCALDVWGLLAAGARLELGARPRRPEDICCVHLGSTDQIAGCRCISAPEHPMKTLLVVELGLNELSFLDLPLLRIWG
jgi:hypothetical protein